MAFKTKLDFSSNRQVKQHEATITVLSGGTSFGLTFSALTSGPDLTTSGVSENYTMIVSTFSGDNTSTIYTWYDPRMELAINTLSALTISNSGITQNTGQVYASSSNTVIDGNTVALSYSGVSFDVADIQIVEISPSTYTGSVVTYNLDILTASTLDFTGRTIWNDVSGITRTERLIITKDAQPNSIFVCSDTEGMGGWIPASGITSGTSLHWYAENVALPAVVPIATGAGSIALGDGAEALDVNMFVYGVNAGINSTGAGHSNFIGVSAGSNATGSSYSNFIGGGAGQNASSAGGSNFIGFNSGSGASGSTVSNFIGPQAGNLANNSTYSNFIGFQTGYQASGSSYSNFIGSSAGYVATGASYSNLFGWNVGASFTNNFVGSNNIIIGTNISLPNSTTDSINIGGVLFGTGTYSTITGNPSIVGRIGTGKIGVNGIPVNLLDAYGPNGDKMLFTDSIIGLPRLAATTSSGGKINSISFGCRAWDETIYDDYGKIGDSFLYASTVSNGLNFINALGSGTDDYIRFFAGKGATSIPDIHIQGTGTTAGYVAIGHENPLEMLHITGNTRVDGNIIISSLPSTDPLATDINGKIVAGTSDIRLKQNINQLENSLEKIKQFRGVSFEYTQESNMGGGIRYGFIAQEVQKITPEIVRPRTNDTEMLSLNYSEIIPVLVEAIKELASGSTTSINTQTILAEDNNIELNYSGNKQTAIGGGISVLHGMGTDLSSDLKTDADGNWITNNGFKSKALTIPTYTPTSSNDANGDEGNITRDDNYLYLKINGSWKRTNLESF